MQLEDFTIARRGNINLKKLIAEKMGIPSSACCHVTTNIVKVAGSSIMREEIYHYSRATVLVNEDHLTIISEDVHRAREGLAQAIGHPLIHYTKPKHHSPHS